MHHIALAVDSIDDAVAEMKTKGVKFTTPKPVQGAHGTRVIFISPSSANGVLVELCEESGGTTC
jgi:methylmalonyl-CoA epimerase